MKITFKLSKHRKVPADNKFDAGLSNYWLKLFYKQFKGW